MLLVQEKIVHLDVIKEHFVCDLNACKGACCWEGDFGAPINENEKEQIASTVPHLLPLLSPQAQHNITTRGMWVDYPQINGDGTPLLEDGSCVYLIRDRRGIAKCGFEILYDQEKTDFQKPISCHLYPIRINSDEGHSFEALNYDRWSICSAACTLGQKLKVPLYQFCKKAIIRKYGLEFYQELDAIAQALSEEDSDL